VIFIFSLYSLIKLTMEIIVLHLLAKERENYGASCNFRQYFRNMKLKLTGLIYVYGPKPPLSLKWCGHADVFPHVSKMTILNYNTRENYGASCNFRQYFSYISWSVLLVEETGKKRRLVASRWQTLSHNVVSSTPGLSWIRTHNLFHSDRRIHLKVN
jgi:hypothetical protein